MSEARDAADAAVKAALKSIGAVDVFEIADWDRRKEWRELFDRAVDDATQAYPEDDPWRHVYSGVLAVVREAASEALKRAAEDVEHDASWHRTQL